jgi:hypothetical protein
VLVAIASWLAFADARGTDPDELATVGSTTTTGGGSSASSTTGPTDPVTTPTTTGGFSVDPGTEPPTTQGGPTSGGVPTPPETVPPVVTVPPVTTGPRPPVTTTTRPTTTRPTTTTTSTTQPPTPAPTVTSFVATYSGSQCRGGYSWILAWQTSDANAVQVRWAQGPATAGDPTGKTTLCIPVRPGAGPSFLLRATGLGGTTSAKTTGVG